MEKIKKLRKILKYNNLDGYLVPKNDEFFGEYVSENKDILKFISGFTGSYGFALILKKKNYLFVDGRYSLQAKTQTKNLFNIITIPNKLPHHLLNNKKLSIGFDPKLHTQHMMMQIFKKTKCKLIPLKKNLINTIWKRKLKEKIKKFYLLEDKYAGKSSKDKIKTILKIIKKNKIDFQFITASENVSWLLNLRGNDCDFSPLAKGYLIINKNNNIFFFCDTKKIDKKLKKKISGIKIININYLEKFLHDIKNKKFKIDGLTCSIYFKNIIETNNNITDTQDSTYILKSIKNKTEIENIKKTHILDGAALTKFIFWIKKNFQNKKITEISAQKKLLKFRKLSKYFKFSSFPTISGSGPNAAIIHYKANPKSNRVLKSGDLYLVDSGGQYFYGTTDVTRTISLDNTNNRIKNIYTRVLKGHIAVSEFKLKKNTLGSEIDKSAREFLKKIKLDYSHGTGHGVGYFLNVHEGPIGISSKNNSKFSEGMVVSNEPGYYENGKFGIRIENLILVAKKDNIKKFENLTMAPIEKSLIEKKLLSKNEVNWLNKYHANVFNNLKTFMNTSQLLELSKSCSNI